MRGIYKMLNKVGREIPEEILKQTGKEVFQGNYYKDNTEFQKQGPITKVVMNHDTSKMVSSIHEALVKCGAHDGMTLGFHHHFRDGDLVVNMVMQEVHNMGIKDVTICASSLGKAHDALVPMIEDGTITNIQSSGVRGKIGEAISAGKLKGLAIMRSHGGRIRAIQTGETVIDISFIGAPTCDDYGNCKGVGGKSDCGVLSYSFVDGNHANKVVAVTDCLVPFPNYPADINMTKVDYVVLAALEIDVNFNCNVVVGSDGVITGAQGGHPDAAMGAKCTIVISPLVQGRIPAICSNVTTVTTPGESVDIVVTDYGVAVNPARQDLLDALKKAKCVPLKTIEELRDIAYSITGEPEPVQFGDRVVGIIEGRDGTIMDVVRQVKPFEFKEA